MSWALGAAMGQWYVLGGTAGGGRPKTAPELPISRGQCRGAERGQDLREGWPAPLPLGLGPNLSARQVFLSERGSHF